MKTASGGIYAKTILALSIFMAMPLMARSQTAGNSGVPNIRFSNVPIKTALAHLFGMSSVTNWDIDPKVSNSMNPEPTVTLEWKNISADAALARLLKEHNLIMVTNSFSTVVRITDTNHIDKPANANLLGSDTNGVMPMVAFSDVPLGIALKTIIAQAHLPVLLDPKVTGEAPPEPPDFRMVSQPSVSLRWRNITAKQAIVELCDLYGLVIVNDSTPDSVVIKQKD